MNLIQAILSKERFRKKKCVYNGNAEGVWLNLTGESDEDMSWIAYDECGTWVKKDQIEYLGNIFDDNWEIDKTRGK